MGKRKLKQINNHLSNPHVYGGLDNLHNKALEELYLTRKSVLTCFQLVENSRFQEGLYVIGYTGPIDEERIKLIFKIINGTRFQSFSIDEHIKLERGEITLEELQEFNAKNKIFCHIGDYDLIYSLFLEKYNIDLNKQDINWFRYLSLLENLFLEENSLTKRIEYRTFKPRYGKGMEELNQNGQALKDKYSL